MAGKTRRRTDWSKNTGFKWSKRLAPGGMFTQLDAKLNSLVAEHLRALMPSIYARLTARIRTGKIAKDGVVRTIPPYSKAYARMLRRAGLSDMPDLSLRGGLLEHLSARIKQIGDLEVQAALVPYGSNDGGSGAWLRRLIRQKEGTPEGMRAVAGYSYVRNGKTITVEPRVTGAAADKPGKPVTYQSIANQMAGRLGYGQWLGLGRSSLGDKAPSRFLTLTAEERSEIERSIAGEASRLVDGMVKSGLV